MYQKDEQDMLAALEQQFFEEEFETVVIPNWFVGVLCYSLPAAWLLPIATQSSNILPSLIFITLIGSGFFYYYRYMQVINSFVKHEKPLLEAMREYKEKEKAEVQNPRMTVLDAQLENHLSDLEQEHWNAITEQLGIDPSAVQDIPEKKRPWWKRNR